MTSELLCVAPPLMYTVMSFPVMPKNSLAVPSHSLGVYQYNKLDMSTFCKQTFVIISTQVCSISSSSTINSWNSLYLFPKNWNWQICHTHLALKLPLCTFSSKLWSSPFPMVKFKTIGFLLDRTENYTPVLFGKLPHELLLEKTLLSSLYAAYLEVASMSAIGRPCCEQGYAQPLSILYLSYVCGNE